MSLRSAFDAILESPQPLDQLDEWLWGNLAAATASKRHAWNAGAFSTVEVQPDGRFAPRTRTVILRSIDREVRSIDFYTDVRSAKFHQLQFERSVEVCWLFYRHTTKIQLRLEGIADLVDVNDEEAAWQSTPLQNRAMYASIEPPGLILPSSQPPDTSDREVTEAESERGRENFRVIRTNVRSADILYLREEGHVRARVEYQQDHQAVVSWVVP